VLLASSWSDGSSSVTSNYHSQKNQCMWKNGSLILMLHWLSEIPRIKLDALFPEMLPVIVRSMTGRSDQGWPNAAGNDKKHCCGD
jgi:hypothetical protein